MYLDPSVSINCKYKIMNNIRLDPLSDVIHIICIVLEGKLMCWNKIAFYDKFSTSNLFSGITHGIIDVTIITQQ